MDSVGKRRRSARYIITNGKSYAIKSHDRTLRKTKTPLYEFNVHIIPISNSLSLFTTLVLDPN